MEICKIKDCKNKVHAKGWCNKHYMRWYRNGNPNIVKVKQHGYSNDHLYKIWAGMKRRCYNKNETSYKNYGGRGITVGKEWINNPKAFIEWALPLWKKGLQIDRKDNDDNYEPLNCHFITCKENIHNKRLLRNDNTSGYKGVHYKKDCKKWVAHIKNNDKKKHLGYYSSAKEAALAYDNAVIDNRPKNFS